MIKAKNPFKLNISLNEKLKTLLPYLFPLFAFISLAVFLYGRSDKMLDSDMSSELILGKLLAEEGPFSFLSTNWYYSTEVRVLNTQIVYSTLFRFTDDFHTVRYLGSLINSLIYAVSCGYFVYQAGLKKYVPYITGIILMPFSTEYFKMMLYASYYVPHVAISFVFLGMLFAFLRNTSKKSNIIYGSLMGLLCFVSCLGGLRQLCILFVPLFCASCLILLLKITKLINLEKREILDCKYIRLFIVSFSSLVIGGCGYIINQTLFRTLFSFHKFGGIEFVPFSARGLINVVGGYIELFGADALPSGNLGNFLAVTTFFLFVLFVYSCFSLIIRHNKITDSELIITVFSLFTLIIMVVIYTTTNFEYTKRYLLPTFVFYIPVLTIAIKNMNIKRTVENQKFRKFMQASAAIMLVVLLSISSAQTFKIYDGYRPTRKLGEVVEILKLRDCTKGYATFWNANVMTELSNGEIEVRTWYSNEPVNELDRYHNWLHVKDFKEDEYQGKIFLLFTKDEYKKSTLKDSLNYAGLVLNTDQHVLFIYDNMDSIFA